MRFFSKGKKGEMTTQQIVILILLIVSFAVILFFLLKLNLGQNNEDQICHNSVVSRGNSALPTDSYPLNCKRSYVCITADGSCEGWVDPIIEKVKTEDEVYQVLADELANCWWMFGEGEVDYVGTETFPKLHCSICSQIFFDDSVGKDIFSGTSSFERKNLYDYLEKKNYSEGRSYLNYLKDVNNVKDIPDQGFGRINLTKAQYIFMGMEAKPNSVAWVALGTAGVAAGTFALVTGTFIGVPALVAVGAAGGIGEFSGSYISSVYTNVFGKTTIRPDIMEANSDKWKTLDCDVIDTFN